MYIRLCIQNLFDYFYADSDTDADEIYIRNAQQVSQAMLTHQNRLQQTQLDLDIDLGLIWKFIGLKRQIHQ